MEEYLGNWITKKKTKTILDFTSQWTFKWTANCNSLDMNKSAYLYDCNERKRTNLIHETSTCLINLCIYAVMDMIIGKNYNKIIKFCFV